MGRTILSVVVGLIFGILAFILFQIAANYSYEFDSVSQYATYKEYYDSQPMVLIIDFLATIIASVVGVLSANKIDKGKKLGGIVIVFLSLAFILKTITDRISEGITPPIWFVITEPLSIMVVGYLLYKFNVSQSAEKEISKE
mgnify:FL=1|jgi:hypothetical protein